MFSNVKRFLAGRSKGATVAHHADRRSIYVAELGEPEFSFPDKDSGGIEILAFKRDFSPTEVADDGYVLLTNGMSDRPMALPADADADRAMKRRAELMWYVREPTPEIVAALRWLAQYPFIDKTWLGFGHRIPMPSPPVTGSDFRTFLFLTPIIAHDQRIAEELSIEGDAVDILTVNLISDAEYQLIRDDGLDVFLDLLDEKDHPPIFDPGRKSYVSTPPDRDGPLYTGASSVKPRHVLCVLGSDRDLKPLRDAANAAISTFATGFSVDETYSQAEPDERMSQSFTACRDRVAPDAWTEGDEEAVANHQSVLYVLGPPMTKDAAVTVSMVALRLVDRLTKAGAVAVKGESAGVAHGLHRWNELVAQGVVAVNAGDPLAQSRVCRLAFAKRPLSSTNYLESVGFHLVGLPDVYVPKWHESEGQSIAVMDAIADEMARRGVEATLQAHGATRIEDSSHDADDFKFNPYGIVVLTS